MSEKVTLELDITPEREGTYFTLPFTMPENTESLTLRYSYPRYPESELPSGKGVFIARPETSIIDLGLIAPGGSQVGASGSDKTKIYLSETGSTPGYRSHQLVPGEWQILVGAYKIAPEGVHVTYELTFASKHLRLLKGDLHTHTLASDGVCTVEELGQRAVRNGLDYLAITDHNQMISAGELPQIPGLTLIPGIEWTHYQGHANFLGVDQPYDLPFFANTPEEARQRFETARERGALITINHPFEEGMNFAYDLSQFPFDCLEIWNGPMRVSNLRTVGYWQGLLAAGIKVPACGGSDYHRDTPFIFPGGPTTCVFAMSASASDILAALRLGHSFITFAPNGPTLEFSCGDAIMGDTVSIGEGKELQILAEGLLAGDLVRVVTGTGSEDLVTAPSNGLYRGAFPVTAPGFARVEIWRSFLPGLPALPALLSNPIYLEP